MAKLFTRASVNGATLPGGNLKATLTALWDALNTGGFSDSSRTTITTSATLATTQCGLLLVDATSGSIVLTAPTSGSTTDDAVFTIRRIDSTPANTVTFARGGSDTIEGSATAFSIPPGGSTEFQMPGGATNWRVLMLTGGTGQGARDNIGIGNGPGRNGFINGGCSVAQRSALTVNLSTTAQVGQVDDLALWASTGAVSAGTLTQRAAPNVGSSGFSAKVASATLTGSAVISARKRIESKDAVKFKNKNCIAQVKVYHDVGSPINYTIIVRKPTAVDNYGSVTTVYTGTATSVASATATTLSIPSQAVGDVSNGVEVEVQAACGAVTTKNFEFTEFQFAEETLPSIFEQRPFRDEQRACERFLPSFQSPSAGNLGVTMAQAISGTQILAVHQFRVPTLKQVTGASLSSSADFSMTNGAGTPLAGTGVSFNSATLNSCTLAYTCSTGLVAGNASLLLTANATARILFTGAELAA